jgi:hypothetical protein
MKIYFSASSQNIVLRIAAYRTICSAVIDSGNTLTRDWVEEVYAQAIAKEQNTYDTVSRRVSYEKSLKALDEADLVILDTSDETFNTGYQAATALQKEKPILIVSSVVREQITFTMGESTYLKQHLYYKNIKELETGVHKFIIDNDLKNKEMRFNLVLGRSIYSYLKEESEATSKTKAQVVRSILEQHIKNLADK